MALIENKTENIVNVIDKPSGKQKMFVSGLNVVPDADWEILRDACKRKLDRKSFVEIGVTKVTEKPREIKGKETKIKTFEFTAKSLNDIEKNEAIRLIEDCYNKEDLEKIKDQLKGDELRNAVQTRIEEINKGLESATKKTRSKKK